MSLQPTGDQHSFARPKEARVTDIDLSLTLDMIGRTLGGTATLSVVGVGTEVILDTKGLNIHGVHLGTGQALDYFMGTNDPILGSALHIHLPKALPGWPGESQEAGAISPQALEPPSASLARGPQDAPENPGQTGETPPTRIVIGYTTSPEAGALQWLTAAEASSRKPFVFSQGEAILTRSIIPCQDTPAVRVSWSAVVRSASPQTVLMSGIRNPESDDRTVRYRSAHPVPSYLIAIAAGDLVFRPTGPRTGVWALPQVVDAAAREFEDMEAMVQAAERLYGPYDWGRFDALVMPPSFPMGGMENPCLTFITPSIIVGDKSLVSVVAHELAHSWSGNKVTNDNWSDLWLNEGLTMYAEHRIVEEMYGAPVAEIHRTVDGQVLAENIAELGGQSERTCLCVPLHGRDPDDAFTYIPYHKGSAVWRRLESILTRPVFDAYLKEYIDQFAWQSISGSDWLAFWRSRLTLEQWALLDAKGWLYGPGIPKGQPSEIPYPSSSLLDLAVERMDELLQEPETIEADGATNNWTPYQWIALIKSLPAETPAGQFAAADRVFGLSGSPNPEICLAWCQRALSVGDKSAWDGAARLVSRVGRLKLVKPLYELMYRMDPGAAAELYQENRPSYHSLVTGVLDGIVGAGAG